MVTLAYFPTVCPICKGSGWVCEAHPELPFMHAPSCDAEGKACRCNPTAAMPPDVEIVASVETVNNVAVRAQRSRKRR